MSDVVTLIIGLGMLISPLLLAGLVVDRLLAAYRQRRAPRREVFTSCWIEDERIVAEGRATPGTILFDHVLVSVNGTDVEMVIVEINVGGGRGATWAAQDLASMKARHLVGG